MAMENGEIRWFSPDLLLHELTDLPDALDDLPEALVALSPSP